MTACSHQGIRGEGRGDYPVCAPLPGRLGRIMEGEIKSPPCSPLLRPALHFRSSFHFKPDRIERLMWNTAGRAGGSNYCILTKKLILGRGTYFVIHVWPNTVDEQAEGTGLPSTQPPHLQTDRRLKLSFWCVGRPPRLDKPIRLTMIGRENEGRERSEIGRRGI